MNSTPSTYQKRLSELLSDAKRIASEFRSLTGKPLGITGEIAEYEAARLLSLTLMPPRQAGYDAIEVVDGIERKLQIKGRCVLPESKPGQKLGSIDLSKEFDSVLLVILDEHLNATEIYEAERSLVEDALRKPGSVARNERGQLGFSQFKRLAKKRWSKS